MKITGIICELNPAHNGHKYIFDKAKELTNADYIFAIMSGDYVQRGEPALINKHVRTHMALELGANAVFELPGIFATGSAQYFARGAIAMLKALGANTVVFGSECGDIDLLTSNEFHSPNDILGSEYIKAIKYLNANITPIAVKRIGSDYNDSDNIIDNIGSASYIRQHLEMNLSNIIPDKVYSMLMNHIDRFEPVGINDFSDILIYKLLSEKYEGFDKYFDIYKDLSDKIVKHIFEYNDFNDFCYKLKSKEIAFAHIKRGLLHILLNLTKSDIEYVSSNNYIAYIRLLGFDQKKKQLFTDINYSKEVNCKIILKLSDAKNILSPKAMELFNKDIQASNLYEYICNKKSGIINIKNEMTKPINKKEHF